MRLFLLLRISLMEMDDADPPQGGGCGDEEVTGVVICGDRAQPRPYKPPLREETR